MCAPAAPVLTHSLYGKGFPAFHVGQVDQPEKLEGLYYTVYQQLIAILGLMNSFYLF